MVFSKSREQIESNETCSDKFHRCIEELCELEGGLKRCSTHNEKMDSIQTHKRKCVDAEILIGNLFKLMNQQEHNWMIIVERQKLIQIETICSMEWNINWRRTKQKL
jgi:hypothetical protein